MKNVLLSNGRRTEDFENFVPLKPGKSGKISLSILTREANASIPCSSARTQIFGGDPELYVKYKHRTQWRQLSEEGQGVWMTDLPIEQYQMRDQLKPIRRRHLRTFLVGGLGLGIAARILARRGTRVVVVERSPDVIKLVRDTVCEQSRPKVEVVCADLFDYLKTTQERFDAAFFDIWQSDGETTLHKVVVPLRKLATQNGVVSGAANVVNWNENVMLGQVYTGIHTRLAMALKFERDPGLMAKAWEAARFEALCEKMEPTYHDFAVPIYRQVRDLFKSTGNENVEDYMSLVADGLRRYALFGSAE